MIYILIVKGRATSLSVNDCKVFLPSLNKVTYLLTLEHKIHIFELTYKCSFYYIDKLMTAFLRISEDF